MRLRRSWWVLVALVAASMLGCGASHSAVSDCAIQGFKVVSMIVPGDSTRPVARQMRVFDRRRRLSDRVPRSLTDLTKEASVLTGTSPVIPRRSRRLLTTRHGAKVFAAPTEDGNVCWQVTVTLESGCSSGGSGFQVLALDPGGPGACTPAHVVGIIPDSVRSVAVVVRGHGYRAEIGTNAFFLQLANASFGHDAASAVVLTLKSGRRVRTSLRFR